MEIPGPDIHGSPFLQILRFHEYIFADNHLKWCERYVNFMAYDLTARRDSRPQSEAVAVLDDFFFQTKRFHVIPVAVPTRESLTEKRGPGIFLALLYCHLANVLGIKTQILNWPTNYYVRRTCDKGTVYVNLGNGGKVLSEDELINLLSKNHRKHALLTEREACIRFLRKIVNTLKPTDNFVAHHRALNILLNAEPENTKWLAERALLRRQMGLYKESLQDLKRYFAFVEHHNAAKEVVDVYAELQTHEFV